MADNTTLNTMTGGDVIATDDIAGVKYQRVKIVEGADGTNDGDISSANPLPVAQTGALPAGTAAIGKLAANSGVDIGDVDITSIAAGDNNIGNVDIVSLPAGNLGMQLMAASLSIVPASNITDATYIGDIKFGESLPAGTAAIGKLAANSGVDIGDVDVLTMPVRDRLTDNQGVALQTDAIMNDTTALTPKFAIIDAATSGDNTLVAAVSSKKIRVLAAFLIAAGTTTTRFESGAGGTALSGQMNLVANVGFVLPFNPVGWCETAATTLLNLELSAAISVDGCLVYVEV